MADCKSTTVFATAPFATALFATRSFAVQLPFQSGLIDCTLAVPHNPNSTLLMRHALMYVGGFERNFPNLSKSSSSFTGTDGKEHAYQPWPSSADGPRT